MKKILVLATAILATTAATTARANDDAAIAIGGFILGTIVGSANRQPAPRDYPPPPPPAPVYRQTVSVPIYQRVCEIVHDYDISGRPQTWRNCYDTVVGYREVEVR